MPRTACPLGGTTVTCTSTDSSGNRSTGTSRVVVQYAFEGFLPPVRDGDSYRLWSTIPVEFRLVGASAGVADADARLLVSGVGSGSEVRPGPAAPPAAATPSATAEGSASSTGPLRA